MTQTLTPGANAPLPDDSVTLHIDSTNPIDTAAYRLAANGKVRGDGDMIFYGQRQSDDSAAHMSGHERASQYTLHLAKQPPAIERIALAYSADAPAGLVNLRIIHNGQTLITCTLDTQGRSEKAMILGECYRRGGQWKFRYIAQGFNGGLKPLSEHFGVDIADDAPAPTPTPAPAPAVNLRKITLDKQRSSITLDKQQNLGDIRINLNWNRNNPAQATGGLLGNLFNKNKNVDLDLGAFIALQNGDKTCIQALGGNFGDLQRPPYAKLRADDRTGQFAEGEWLDINGRAWANIREILVYAFIYEGAPNWDGTDGIATLYVEGREIETRLTEGERNRGMCAVARLINDNGGIRVERLNRYFTGHKDMDNAYGWGFRWTAGRK